MPSFLLVLVATKAEVPSRLDGPWTRTYEAWRRARGDRPDSLVDFAEETGAPSRVSTANLAHMEDCRPIKGVRGARLAFLGSHAAATNFSIGGRPQIVDELNGLPEIVRAYGGEALAMWTYGSALLMALVRGREVGRRPETTELSLRLARPSDRPRPRATWESLARWLEASPLEVDVKALEREYAAERLSVSEWFAAFGATGVKDVRPDAAWEAFFSASTALLTGRSPDAAEVRLVNGYLKSADEDCDLPRKPGKPGRGETALAIACTAAGLEERLGPPATGVLAERHSLGRLYGEIASGESVAGLSVGSDRKGLGTSASLSRLLAHAPRRLGRDGVALSLLAEDAEAWNGRAFVDPLRRLAEVTATAGFTLAVFPASLAEPFRKAFGITFSEERAGRPPKAATKWTAEAFLDGPFLAVSPSEAIATWFAKQACDGLLLRAEPGGKVSLEAFRGGSRAAGGAEVVGGRPAEAEALSGAARDLWPRGALVSLGLPDLLEPMAVVTGAMRRGAGTRGGRKGEKELQRARARLSELLRDLPEPTRVTSLHAAGLPGSLEGDTIGVRISLSMSDAGFVGSVARDLADPDGLSLGSSMGRPAWAWKRLWVDGSDIQCLESLVHTQRVLQVIGDAPDGSRLALVVAGTKKVAARRFHVEIAAAG